MQRGNAGLIALISYVSVHRRSNGNLLCGFTDIYPSFGVGISHQTQLVQRRNDWTHGIQSDPRAVPN